MSPSTSHTLWWLAGPGIGIFLVASFAWTGLGPGLFFWATFTGLTFVVGTPILQLALLRTARLRGQHAAVCAAAIAIVACCAAIAWTSGAFAFW